MKCKRAKTMYLKKINYATAFSLLRFFCLPFFIFSILVEKHNGMHYLPFFTFAVFSITDFIDGYIARHCGLATKSGAFLDSIADKVLVVSCLFFIVYAYHNIYILITAMIITFREFLMISLRFFNEQHNLKLQLEVQVLGKIKMMAQVLAILLLLYGSSCASESQVYKNVVMIGKIMLYFSVFLTLISMIIYVSQSLQRPTLKKILQR
jgi:CDP-diacylglycerol--glycerol-3-phosphate 3-phosphatidyltransferase